MDQIVRPNRLSDAVLLEKQGCKPLVLVAVTVTDTGDFRGFIRSKSGAKMRKPITVSAKDLKRQKLLVRNTRGA
jgi:hypothetical protein